MIVLENVDLSKYTTFRMGGIAKKMYIPESMGELVEVTSKVPVPEYYIGGGSNLLINDKKVFDCVICLRKFNQSIINEGNGRFTVGGSVRLQALIKAVNEEGYGGIEYLYSVPGLVGGAVAMNAGRGKAYNKTISDYIKKVKVLHAGQIITYTKEECQFSHRTSIFKGTNDIIMEVTFCFEKEEKNELEKRRMERISLHKEKQDMSFPNFGTVFQEADGRILRLICKWPIHSGKVHYSSKTANWLLNEGGTFQDAMRKIDKVKKIHHILGKQIKEEVVIWK